MDAFITNIPYTKNVDLKTEILEIYVPYMICRSEQWYNHSVYLTSSYSWGSSQGTCGFPISVKDGNAEVLYFKTFILHVFGTITYWNDEIRKYDVIDVLEISFCLSHDN